MPNISIEIVIQQYAGIHNLELSILKYFSLHKLLHKPRIKLINSDSILLEWQIIPVWQFVLRILTLHAGRQRSLMVLQQINTVELTAQFCVSTAALKNQHWIVHYMTLKLETAYARIQRQQLELGIIM